MYTIYTSNVTCTLPHAAGGHSAIGSFPVNFQVKFLGKAEVQEARSEEAVGGWLVMYLCVQTQLSRPLVALSLRRC